MPSMSNGQAVMLGREMRVRLSPQHHLSLTTLAKRHGWSSPTAFAEALLADAIETKSRNTVMAHVLSVVASAWMGARRA